jgi:translation initiation factor 4G
VEPNLGSVSSSLPAAAEALLDGSQQSAHNDSMAANGATERRSETTESMHAEFSDAEPAPPTVLDVSQLPAKFAYKDPLDVSNFVEPAEGEQRRTYALDAMRAMKESFTHRLGGMEEAVPGFEEESAVTMPASGPKKQAATKKGDNLVDVAPLQISENRWVAKVADESKSSAELVVKNVRGIMNKLTAANFDRLFQQIVDCGIANATVLTGVIDLVYDKAVTEHTFCGLYAQLCSSLCEKMPELAISETETTTFRKILLRKCQYEFENRHMVILSEPRGAEAAEELQADADLLEIKRKQRVLGNIKFVGELFKKNLLSEPIMHGCIYMLFGGPENIPEEEELEGMCKLMGTIGQTLDTEAGKTKMNQYFTRCQQIAKDERTCYRVRFMLQDLDDLRRRGWQVRAIEAAANKAVTTKEKEAAKKQSEAKLKEKAAKKAEEKAAKQKARDKAASKAARPAVEDGWAVAGGAVKKPMKGKVVAGKLQANGKVEPAKAVPSVGGAKKLGGFAALMGGDSDSDDDSDDEAAAAAAAEDEPSSAGSESDAEKDDDDDDDDDDEKEATGFTQEELVKKTKGLLEEFMSAQDVSEAVLCVQELNAPHFHPHFVCRALTSVLERKDQHRELAIRLLHKLSTEGVVTSAQLMAGIEEAGSQIEDLEYDIPFAGKLIMQMVGKLIALGLIRFRSLPAIVPFFSKAKLPALLADLCSAVEGASSADNLRELYNADKAEFSFSASISTQDIERFPLLSALA